MAIFRAAPTGAQSVPIFRVGSKKYGKFHVAILDDAPLFVTTHYVPGQRTQPCIGNGCKWCHTGEAGEKPQPRRERAYIGVIMIERRIRGVLELTATAGGGLLEISKQQSLIGLTLKCDRESEKPTSAIKLEPMPQASNVTKSLEGWDLVSALCATWGIDHPATKAKLHGPEEFAARDQDEEDVWVNRRNGKGVA